MTAIYSLQQDNYRPMRGIQHSYPDTERKFVSPSSRGHHIKYGDRVFARVVMQGRTVVEFVMSQINDLTELFGELRHKMRGIRGLAKLYIRNMSRGWSEERPMMFYTELPFSFRRPAEVSGAPGSAATSPSRMLFPWETH